MASHKPLKSVANSLVGSFASTLNYWDDDYVMGHVVQAAWLTGATSLRVDLLSGATDGSPLLVSSVAGSIAGYVGRFPDLVERSGSSMSLVSAAALTVTVDPLTRRPYRVVPLEESPFSCTVAITDDRGRVYDYTLSDWWFPEQPYGVGSTAIELGFGA